ncbi:aggregation-promoting factor C-terminal-like domain-containing protein [Nocardioides terrisoli]|uniref:aggregation-promoting factor C-terminal-like domain-containing protein n=1 Tax=Nocardioides terrisoli TaxID=3388267 RepID=UPI00287BC5D1|nr:lytic transglycosylase domain-containing protein [Nocardioides marmorisolisilvae]
MPKTKYAPKHRGAPVKTHAATRQGVKNAAVFSGVAVAATGIAVSTGVVTSNGPIDGAAAALTASGTTHHLSAADLAAREQSASRSSDDRRAAADKLKERALSNASGVAHTSSEDLSTSDPQTLARTLMPQYGMSSSQFSCLDSIWSQESGWNVHAANPSSSAYGIPQALPGSKMASAGANWQNSAETQIRWGLGYIRDRYGSACSAWAFKRAHGWY